MPRLMEHSRRPGPFDPRFRVCRSRSAAVAARTAGDPEIAGWEDDGGALRERRDAGQTRAVVVTTGSPRIAALTPGGRRSSPEQ